MLVGVGGGGVGVTSLLNFLFGNVSVVVGFYLQSGPAI